MKGGILFIAIVPEEEIQREVTQFKQAAAEKFDSRHALKSPPHITLFPPFKWPSSRVLELEECLQDFAAGASSFELELNNFDCFRPRVIFVDVEENEKLSKLQRELGDHLEANLELKSRDRRPYHPHLTIAFKDLKRSVFPEAWAHFQSMQYRRSFKVDDISLLRHNGKIWELKRRYLLEGEE